MAIVNKYVLPMLFAIGLLMMTLILGFESIIFNEMYFEWHYTNRDVSETTGMSVDDLMDTTILMLDYLRDRAPSLDMQAMIDGEMEEVFGQREKDHMIDVKDLYLGARNIRRIGMGIVLGIILYGAFVSKIALYEVLNRMKYTLSALMVIIIAVGGLFALDFNKYFVLFHETFFTNDLWILDPRTDILINMVPESYFYSIVMIGVSMFILFIVLAFVLASVVKKKLKVVT